MQIFGFHFCQDELFVLMQAMPFVGVAIAWVRARVRARRG